MKKGTEASVGLMNRRPATDEEIRSLPRVPSERSTVEYDGASWLKTDGVIYRIVEDPKPRS